MEKNEILIGAINNNIYLKAKGHITANLSFPVREDLFKKISTLKNEIKIYFDLSEVSYMDSTFIGLLVGIDKKLKTTFNNNLTLINSSEIAIDLLKKMNLATFLKQSNEDIPKNIQFENFDETINISEEDKLKTILIAHKDLSSLNFENSKKFGSLIETLEKQIDNK